MFFHAFLLHIFLLFFLRYNLCTQGLQIFIILCSISLLLFIFFNDLDFFFC